MKRKIEVLQLVLKSFDAELRGEIGKTDNWGYKAAPSWRGICYQEAD